MATSCSVSGHARLPLSLPHQKPVHLNPPSSSSTCCSTNSWSISVRYSSPGMVSAGAGADTHCASFPLLSPAANVSECTSRSLSKDTMPRSSFYTQRYSRGRHNQVPTRIMYDIKCHYNLLSPSELPVGIVLALL